MFMCCVLDQNLASTSPFCSTAVVSLLQSDFHLSSACTCSSISFNLWYQGRKCQCCEHWHPATLLTAHLMAMWLVCSCCSDSDPDTRTHSLWSCTFFFFFCLPLFTREAAFIFHSNKLYTTAFVPSCYHCWKRFRNILLLVEKLLQP